MINTVLSWLRDRVRPQKLSTRFIFPHEESWPRILDPTIQEFVPCPPFASEQQAFERASRLRAGTLHKVQVFPDHGRGLPVWDADAGYAFDTADYPISTLLADRMTVWASEWITEADRVMSQSSPGFSLPESWYARGDTLTRQLAEEVWSFADVYPRFRDC